VLSLALRALPWRDVGHSSFSGMRKVFQALAVLLLAWTLGDVIEATGAAAWIASALGDRLSPAWLPALTFLLAAGTAFSTGSSFFTMGTLIPLVVPLAVQLEGAGVAGPVLLASTAAVLDGAVLGDHASPISDTTILSSLGSAVDVVTHVRTQLPYALTVGVLAIVCGAIPAGFGWSPWLGVLVGSVACVAVVYALGSTPEARGPSTTVRAAPPPGPAG
jgi:Na+/H+ antiporter NhaC